MGSSSLSCCFSRLTSLQSHDRLLGTRRVGFREGRGPCLAIRAVAGVEPKCTDHKGQVGDIAAVETSSMRRPWNKGKKHTAETILMIKERTKLAMQSPQVRMKLVKFGHRHSKETKRKIGAGVRVGWKRRRKKMKMQEMCFYLWQNLIAEASRNGLPGDKRMCWNSYEILDQQLEKEWLASIVQRKSIPRPKGGQRPLKTPEQRRRIAEAISAKWADPAYRERVCSGMAKYYGKSVRTERNPRRGLCGDRKSTTENSVKKTCDLDSASNKVHIESSNVGRSKKPLYKDPLAISKLKMIKNIRSRREAVESEISKALEQASLSIAQAEKAAEALEFAATRSSAARASLQETRKLIAEAVKLIKAVEARETPSDESMEIEEAGREKAKHLFEEPNCGLIVNGRQSPLLNNAMDFDFSKFNLEGHFTISVLGEISKLQNATQRTVHLDENKGSPPVPAKARKKWVRGRLVEFVDEARQL